MMMIWFPTYLDKYNKLTQELMTGGGPLPVEQRYSRLIRYFLALLGVSAYGCDYLYHRLKDSFIEYGGVFKYNLRTSHGSKKAIHSCPPPLSS